MVKNRFLKIAVVTGLFLGFFSCDTNEDDVMQAYVTGAVFPVITEVGSSFFDILDIENAYVNFTVTADQTIAESITIEKTYKGTRTEIGTFTSFPVTINVTAEEAVSDISGVTVGDIDLGDTFLFEVIVTSKSGLRTRSNVIVNAPVACKSDLGGTFTFATIVSAVGEDGDLSGCDGGVTGEGSFIENGAGFYRISDATFGQYDCAWGDNPATGVTLTDVCNELTVGGSDQYGLVYSFVILSNNGTDLEIEWSNSYGDKGKSVLTRNDGKSWPLDLSIK